MEKQKKMHIESALDTIFASGLEEKVFPGAGVGFTCRNRVGISSHFYKVYGYTETGCEKEQVQPDTFFDLASLTKPLVTVLSLLTLIENGRLSLDASLDSLLPDYAVPKDKKKIRLDQLMSHCAGFPAHRPYYLRLLQIAPDRRKQAVLESIMNEELQGTGEVYVYSDLGYMLLGMIVESQSGMQLHEFFRKYILSPLGLSSCFVFPAKEPHDTLNFCATEVCPWTNRLLSGSVHDDNCRVLGGVMGHAGMFGTIEGVLTLATYLNGLYRAEVSRKIVSPELFQKAATRRKGTTWSCGFDMPSKLYSSSGRYFSERSIGHLGFTGTSFWCDPVKGITIVLLTNRVCPTRKNEKIKRFRPKLHNLLMEALST